MKYQVIVSNIGQVYDGDDREEARKHYRDYTAKSKANEGRAAGESVTLFQDGEPLFDFLGSLDAKDDEDNDWH